MALGTPSHSPPDEYPRRGARGDKHRRSPAVFGTVSGRGRRGMGRRRGTSYRHRGIDRGCGRGYMAWHPYRGRVYPDQLSFMTELGLMAGLPVDEGSDGEKTGLLPAPVRQERSAGQGPPPSANGDGLNSVTGPQSLVHLTDFKGPRNSGVTSSHSHSDSRAGLPSDHRNSTKTLPPIGIPRLSLLLRTMTAASR